jgi:cell division protein FtsQ
VSRFRRKREAGKASANLAPGDSIDQFANFPVLSDVTLVKRTPRDESKVLAELSVAFGADSNESIGEDESDDATAPTGVDRDRPDDHSPLRTIAIGGNDDLPDAVYLDEALGDESIGAGSVETVFIDDDGTGDALLPKDATRRGMEPRLRQRRIGVRRAEGRRRLKRVAVIGTIVVLVTTVLAVLGSGLFAIDRVDVTGVANADPVAVAAVVDDLVGTPVLRADTDEAEGRLESIPWVESARVRTDFPNAATIELRERTAVATVRGTDGQFRILDRDGRVLDVIAGQPVAFALITAPVVADLQPGQFGGVGHAAAAAIVTKLRPEVRSRLVSISTTDDGSDLRFVLTNAPGGEIEVRLGAAITDNDQIERLVRLELVLDDISGTETTAIDVSTNEATDR